MATPAYFVFDVKVNHPEGMAPYMEKAASTLATYGGTCLVLGGTLETLEGNGPQGNIVIVQFSSPEQARAWYGSPEYQAIIGYRHAAAETHAYLVEGITL